MYEFDITINELFNRERIKSNNYELKANENLDREY